MNHTGYPKGHPIRVELERREAEENWNLLRDQIAEFANCFANKKGLLIPLHNVPDDTPLNMLSKISTPCIKTGDIEKGILD